MLKAIKQFFGYEDFNVEDTLSPSCLLLLKACCWFEDDASIEAIGIYPEQKTLVAGFVCTSDNRIDVTFSGVVDASATYKGEALVRSEIMRLPYQHDVDEFEVRGTCLYRDRETIFHTHIVKLIAEGLIVMFTFGDLSFTQVSDDENAASPQR
jgi:hypothetical protein